MRYAKIYYALSLPRDLYRFLLIHYYFVKILEYIVANCTGAHADRGNTPTLAGIFILQFRRMMSVL
jgi:hypothetical protein